MIHFASRKRREGKRNGLKWPAAKIRREGEQRRKGQLGSESKLIHPSRLVVEGEEQAQAAGAVAGRTATTRQPVGDTTAADRSSLLCTLVRIIRRRTLIFGHESEILQLSGECSGKEVQPVDDNMTHAFKKRELPSKESEREPVIEPLKCCSWQVVPAKCIHAVSRAVENRDAST